MPTPSRSRNRSSEIQEFEDFDPEDEENPRPSRQGGQKKMQVLLSNLLGRWYWIVLGLVLGILGAAYYLSKTPKQYTATTTLLLKQQTANVMSRDQVDDIDMRSIEAVNTVAERIGRMDLLERVAARQDVRSLPGLVPVEVNWMPEWLAGTLSRETPSADSKPQSAPPPAALGGMIGSWMKISIRRGTRLLDISITHPVPEVTTAVADAIAFEYLAEIVSARTENNNDSIHLLQKQSEEARSSLQLARGSLAIYARALEIHKILDVKEAETAGLQRRYLARHPKMVTASAELRSLQEQFLREFNVAREDHNEKVQWDTAAKDLPDHLAEPEKYLRMARQKLLGRIGVLESEIQSSTLVFNSMLTRIEETGVNQASAVSSTEISNLARTPGAPSAPVPTKIFAMGGVGGLAAGLAVALLLSRLDNKFHTVAQIAGEMDVTILAAIAEINQQHLAAANREFRERHPENKENFHAKWDNRLLFRPGASTTSYAEMYRILRASVSLLGDENKRKVTLFSSALPGEGKTLTSANFALAAAGQGRKTLLIDLDLRKPALHKIFGLPREQERGGSTECLAGQVPFEQVIIRDTGVENFHLILSGKRSPHPGELLSTGRLNVILDEACSLYDVVVIDTAPILAVPDARIIAPLVNNVCLVCRAEYVPKGAVRHVLSVLAEDGTSLSGVVFNGFREKRRLIGQNYSYGHYKTSRYGKAYRYGYGSYGAYGNEDDT